MLRKKLYTCHPRSAMRKAAPEIEISRIVSMLAVGSEDEVNKRMYRGLGTPKIRILKKEPKNSY
jgi:hypothetical protein